MILNFIIADARDLAVKRDHVSLKVGEKFNLFGWCEDERTWSFSFCRRSDSGSFPESSTQSKCFVCSVGLNANRIRSNSLASADPAGFSGSRSRAPKQGNFWGADFWMLELVFSDPLPILKFWGILRTRIGETCPVSGDHLEHWILLLAPCTLHQITSFHPTQVMFL